MTEEIDDREILDEAIQELRDRLGRTEDTATWLKLNDRLLKALSLRAKSRASRGKSRGFDLGKTQ
jgi:hypothetical protein